MTNVTCINFVSDHGATPVVKTGGTGISYNFVNMP